MYKRLRVPVFVANADAHAQMLVVLGSEQLDVLEDRYLEFLVAVRVVWLYCSFCGLEDGVLRALLVVLHDSTELLCSHDLAL